MGVYFLHFFPKMLHSKNRFFWGSGGSWKKSEESRPSLFFIIEKSQKSYDIYITIFRLVAKTEGNSACISSKYKWLQLATMQEIGSVIKVSLWIIRAEWASHEAKEVLANWSIKELVCSAWISVRFFGNGPNF